jgi:uncharacterized surface protein with fasciclin (FAS1) repeats
MITSIFKSKLTLGLVVAAFVSVLSLPQLANANGKSAAAMAAKPGTENIAEIAIANGSFTTLVTALSCTDLVSAVSGNRQLTVFAPTDAAFAKLGLNSNNVCSTPGLSNILLYHVMSGRHTSTSVLARDSYRMLNGSTLTQEKLGVAGIAIPNISASNGVIHAVNSVLLP